MIMKIQKKKMYVNAIGEREEENENHEAYIEMNELDRVKEAGDGYIYKNDVEPVIVYNF